MAAPSSRSVENEYGSSDNDKLYLKHIYDAIVAAGPARRYSTPPMAPNSAERHAAGRSSGGELRSGRDAGCLQGANCISPNQPLMAENIGAYWSTTGAANTTYGRRAAGARLEVMFAGIFGQSLHVSWRHHVWFHERRQL